MRDVTTVRPGEDCSVYRTENPYVRTAARYHGTFCGRIIAQTAGGIVAGTPGGNLTFLDREGREIGFVDPDPILPTTTPDLE